MDTLRYLSAPFSRLETQKLLAQAYVAGADSQQHTIAGIPMTQDQVNRLAALAVSISTAAPLRLKPPAYQCYIPHELVRQIRAELDAGKYDWRAQHKAARNRGKG
jgi:hypothetical protein